MWGEDLAIMCGYCMTKFGASKASRFCTPSLEFEAS